jgi:hypothetical protein
MAKTDTQMPGNPLMTAIRLAGARPQGLSLGHGRNGHAAQPWIETTSGMIRIATMFVILIIGLIAGPAVSL